MLAMLRGVLALWVGLWLAAAAVAAPDATAPPVEAFFGEPQLRAPALSPSGRWLAALTKSQTQRTAMTIVDLDGKEPPKTIVAGRDDDVVWFRWVTDDWLIFSLDTTDDRAVVGTGGGLMSTSRDGKDSRQLIGRYWKSVEANLAGRRMLEPNHAYLAPGKPGSTEIIIGEYVFDQNRQYSHTVPKVLDVVSGALRLLDADAPRASGWLFDGRGRARVAWRTEKDEISYLWSDSKTGKWTPIGTMPDLDRSFTPAYVTADDELVVMTGGGTGVELRRFDWATQKPASEALVRTPGFSDWPDIVRDPASGDVLGLRFDLENETPVWFAASLRELQARADAKLPGRVNRLQCSPCGRTDRVLVSSYADVDPGIFLVWRPAQDQWQSLGKARPEIDPQTMSRRQFFRTKARDGEDLPVWITRPAAGVQSGAPAGPAVVLVHGGPWSRGGFWTWGSEPQFLASRGYVVIEPEFRGSEGYGDAHFRAGFRQWGQAMQDDVTDALRYAIAKGWVDPARVCIMGASYGGYAALMGVAKDPDQYRCAVAFAAVSDPRFMFDFHWSDISQNSRRYSMQTLLGNREKDEAMFIANSPIEQAARIKAPVLLAHGGKDRRVPIQNAERMHSALTKAKKQVEWLYYPEEFHGFQHPENRFDYYRRVEAFLAKHLKP